MPKVTITSTGLNQIKEGSGLEITAALTQSPKYDVTALTAASTLTKGGVFTIEGSTALGVTLPLAADVPGSVFTLRAASAHAHFLTGSAETAGTRALTDGTSRGSKLALAAAVGNSVTLISDGKNFCVLGNSGSITLSGT